MGYLMAFFFMRALHKILAKIREYDDSHTNMIICRLTFGGEFTMMRALAAHALALRHVDGR